MCVLGETSSCGNHLSLDLYEIVGGPGQCSEVSHQNHRIISWLRGNSDPIPPESSTSVASRFSDWYRRIKCKSVPPGPLGQKKNNIGWTFPALLHVVWILFLGLFYNTFVFSFSPSSLHCSRNISFSLWCIGHELARNYGHSPDCAVTQWARPSPPIIICHHDAHQLNLKWAINGHHVYIYIYNLGHSNPDMASS